MYETAYKTYFAVMCGNVTIIRFVRKEWADEFTNKYNSTEIPLYVIEQLDDYYSSCIIFKYYLPEEKFCRNLLSYRIQEYGL